MPADAVAPCRHSAATYRAAKPRHQTNTGGKARPTHPNKTQYAAGTKVRVHRRASKGVSLVEMPNGEQWHLKSVKG